MESVPSYAAPVAQNQLLPSPSPSMTDQHDKSFSKLSVHGNWVTVHGSVGSEESQGLLMV